MPDRLIHWRQQVQIADRTLRHAEACRARVLTLSKRGLASDPALSQQMLDHLERSLDLLRARRQHLLDMVTWSESCAKHPSEHAERVRSRGARVLVVDDDRDTADTLAMWLQFEAYAVKVAYTSWDAFAQNIDFGPHAIVLDVGMPELDGLRLGGMLRRCRPSVRLIGLSGYGDPPTKARAAAAGFDAYLIKPADLNDVRAALDGLLDYGTDEG